jgi:hypothetical protein
MENRTYIIFSTSEIPLVNFDQVLETSEETVRKNNDQTKAILKWEGSTPSSIELLTTKSDYYNHEQIVNILNVEEWRSNVPYDETL